MNRTGKRRRKSKKSSPGHTPLARHKKKGSILKAPLGDVPFKATLWDRDFLPEHLWIASLRDLAPVDHLFKPYYAFMDAFEEFWPGDFPPLGFISDFGSLGESTEEFLTKHEALVEELFLEPFGRILAFYPDSPASWLVNADFIAAGGRLEPERELGRLRSLVVDLLDPSGELATACKMATFGRIIKSGMIHLPGDVVTVDLMPKYPHGCTVEERRMVESIVRASLNAIFSSGEYYASRDWAKYFWRHNYDLAACRPTYLPLHGGEAVNNEEFKILAAKLERNCKAAREYLGLLADEVRFDLYDPNRDEILNGLFARIVRIYLLVCENPSLWARDAAGIFLRCLVDTAITFIYLTEKGTDDDFRRFREYGEGQKKLLMLHLQDSYPDTETLEGRSASDLAKDLGSGLAAELLQIELGHWSKKDARRLATAVGLERFYRIVYTPTSADVHGTWASLKDSNLLVCGEPLHRFHQLPSYAEPPLYVATLIAVQDLLYEVHERAVNILSFPEHLGITRLSREGSDEDAES